MKLAPALIAGIAVTLIAGSALATQRTWTGAHSANWSDPGNWQNGVPVNGDIVELPVTAPHTWINDLGPITLDSFLLHNDDPVSFSAPAGRDGTITLLAYYQNIPGGSLDVPLVLLSGDVQVYPAGKITMTKPWTFGGGTAVIEGGGVIQQAPILETQRTSLRIHVVLWDGSAAVNTTGDFSLDTSPSPSHIHLDASALGKGTSPAILNVAFLDLTSSTPGPITRALDLRTFTEQGLWLSVKTPDATPTLAGAIALNAKLVAMSDMNLTGPISGTGRLVVFDLSHVTLSNGGNSFSGGVELQGGVLYANTSNTIPAAGDLTGGTGTLYLHAAQTVKSLNCTFLLYFDLGVALHATQSVTLNLCDLWTTQPGGTLPPTIPLIYNDGPLPVTGTFAGLAELASVPVSVNGDVRYVTYHGGDGNDVMLLPTPVVTTQLVRTLQFDQQSYTVAPGATLTVTVTVLDGGGRPVPGETVNFDTPCFATTRPVTGPCLDLVGEAQEITNAQGQAAFTVQAEQLNGMSSLSAFDQSTGNGNTSVQVLIAPIEGYQDMWWAGPQENGWGVSITQHGDTLFALIYAYDGQGKPTWYSMPGGTWDANHTAYTGSLYVPSGSPYYAYDASRFVPGNNIGTATFTFTSENTATLDYRVTLFSDRKFLQRELFGPTTGAKGARGDMWWGGPSQNGWGIAILEQDPVIFPIWFTYDANGRPTWFPVPVGSWTSPDTFAGRIYRTTSSAWLAVAYDPSKLQATDVGSFTIHFNGDTAQVSYTIDNTAGTLSLVKEPF
ncbi:MAG TPA: hypothetical protein VLT89_15650 [Usitatibacter sp.]|nr:hypothetical protein [Usitatibacter sp.]